MADTYLRCGECSKKLKTFQALLKHFEKQHINKRLPRRAVFLQNDEEIGMPVPETIRSSAVQAEYKAWLTGIAERLNGLHHQRHRRKFIITHSCLKMNTHTYAMNVFLLA